MTSTENRLSRPVSDAEFESLFEKFRYTAFRLETLQRYDVEYEKEPLRRFLEEEEIRDSAARAEWGAEIRDGISRGRSYRRVHVVTEPLTDYIRFECVWAYRHNAEAGEDVRIIPVPEGDWPDGLPRFDYWLFDSSRLLRMNYEPDGSMLPAELVDDPEMIVRANLWRDRALHLSIPFNEYAARFDTDMRPL